MLQAALLAGAAVSSMPSWKTKLSTLNPKELLKRCGLTSVALARLKKADGGRRRALKGFGVLVSRLRRNRDELQSQLDRLHREARSAEQARLPLALATRPPTHPTPPRPPPHPKPELPPPLSDREQRGTGHSCNGDR